ncbi:hypothetical protein AB0D09_29765 [Streptomyces sp. NPDC049097]|uniref:hypothetical protein n=1 Tax=Streptomyces sp. NPDC049097 TaxID=3155497 RepID=UPI0034338281
MTEVEPVATELATGAAAGLTDGGHGAVRGLCTALKEAVRRRLGGSHENGCGVRVLDAYKTDPDVWRTRLVQVLTASGAKVDEEILAAARAVPRAERRSGPVDVVARDAGGALIEVGTQRSGAG